MGSKVKLVDLYTVYSVIISGIELRPLKSADGKTWLRRFQLPSGNVTVTVSEKLVVTVTDLESTRRISNVVSTTRYEEHQYSKFVTNFVSELLNSIEE